MSAAVTTPPTASNDTVVVRRSDEPVFTRIEPWGQDIDGDGIASAEEGAYDIDGDGQFTAVEAKALGMKYFINWMPREEYDRLSAAGGLLFEGRVCSSACLSNPQGGFNCQANDQSVNCIDNGGLCQTVPCHVPCACPTN
jgi:hypothetical protein